MLGLVIIIGSFLFGTLPRDLLGSRRVRSKRLTITIGILSMALLIVAACASDPPEPRTPPPPVPTATTPPTPPDPVNGEKVFRANRCSACHSTGTNILEKSLSPGRYYEGPALAGVLERAATRVEGLSAEEYIEQSIRDPGAFVVSGFSNVMPTTFGSLPDNDVQDLVAYLSTLN